MDVTYREIERKWVSQNPIKLWMTKMNLYSKDLMSVFEVSYHTIFRWCDGMSAPDENQILKLSEIMNDSEFPQKFRKWQSLRPNLSKFLKKGGELYDSGTGKTDESPGTSSNADRNDGQEENAGKRTRRSKTKVQRARRDGKEPVHRNGREIDEKLRKDDLPGKADLGGNKRRSNKSGRHKGPGKA